jgi:hypothetical protein
MSNQSKEIYKDFFTVEKRICNDIVNSINSSKSSTVSISVDRDLLRQIVTCYLYFIKDLELKGAEVCQPN